MQMVAFRSVSAPTRPPSRQLAANWRRVIQERVSVSASTATPFATSDWFADKFNTTGFSAIFIHSVTVWTSPTNPTVEDVLKVVPSTPKGLEDSGWSAQGFAGQVNQSTSVKVLWPVHVSGPFGKNTTFMTVTSSATQVIVELDATFT